MATMLNLKFAPGTLARKRLMQTGDLELIHLSGSDFFWGQNRKGEGKNILGKALMQMRNSGCDCSFDLYPIRTFGITQPGKTTLRVVVDNKE